MKDNNGKTVEVGDEIVYIYRTGVYAHDNKLTTGRVVAVSAKSVAVEVDDLLYTVDSCFIIRKRIV